MIPSQATPTGTSQSCILRFFIGTLKPLKLWPLVEVGEYMRLSPSNLGGLSWFLYVSQYSMFVPF